MSSHQLHPAQPERAAGRLFVVGFSHARVPLRLRERYRLNPADRRQLLLDCRQCPPVREVVVLGTCNRFEVYAVAASLTWAPGELVGHILRMIWPDMERADFDQLAASAYWHEDEACARHLFRTAASLDSMVVGEPEINGQVKQAYFLAREVGATGPVLNRLFQNAFTAAKAVRTGTNIARGFVSVGTVAVRAALTAADGAADSALVCGAGQMGATMARHLRKHFAGPIRITNRTPERATALAAEVGGDTVPWAQRGPAAAASDIVLVATGASEPVLRAGDFAGAGRVVVVDVGLPRAVEAAVRQCAGVRLFDLDDLQAAVAAGREQRQADVDVAEAVVAGQVAAFWPRLCFALGRGECPVSARRDIVLADLEMAR